MLLYIYSPLFPGHSFVVMVNSTDTIARIRAHLLHDLFEIGHYNHQFKLCYKQQYLRDAYTIQDYSISSNDVLAMVPISEGDFTNTDSYSDVRSVNSIQLNTDFGELRIYSSVQTAMEKEIKTFMRRESLVEIFKGLMWLQLIMTFLGVFTTYWYCIFWYFVLFYFCWSRCPNYCRQTGFTGTWSILKFQFCYLYSGLSLIMFLGDVMMAVLSIRTMLLNGCSTSTYDTYCTRQNVYSSLFYVSNAVLLASLSALCVVMLKNFRIEIGDYMEQHLVATRDVVKLLEIARHGSTHDRRVAAFELATFAASGDDNKFRICAEGGLEVLAGLLVCGDPATGEPAVEAVTELLTVPSIQTAFVESGGAQSLLTVLRSAAHPKLVDDSAAALSYLLCENSEHQDAVLDSGLEDLCHAAVLGPPAARKIIAGLFLELTFNKRARPEMLSALISLGSSSDSDTARFSLQTLELMALESRKSIFTNNLLVLLLDTPRRSLDHKLLLMAAKLLLYFAEDAQQIAQLLTKSDLTESLGRFARCRDPLLQKLIIKIIFCLYESPLTRTGAKQVSLEDIVKGIKSNAGDSETVEMADQALRLLHTDDALIALPKVNTMDKMLFSDNLESTLTELRQEAVSRASQSSSQGSVASLREIRKKNS